MRVQLVSVFMASLVVFSGVYASQMALPERPAAAVSDTLDQVAVGLRYLLEPRADALAQGFFDTQNSIAETQVRVASATRQTSESLAPLLLQRPDLSLVQMSVPARDERTFALATASAQTEAGQTMTIAQVRSQLTAASNLATSPDALLALMVGAYRGIGVGGYRAIRAVQSGYLSLIERSGGVALTSGEMLRDILADMPRQSVQGLATAGSGVVTATHAIISGEVSLIYGSVKLAPRVAKASVGFVGTTGAYLTASVGYSVVEAPRAIAFLTEAPARYAPRIAQTVWGAEYRIAMRFVPAAQTIALGYLHSVEGAGGLAYASAHRAVAYTNEAQGLLLVAGSRVAREYGTAAALLGFTSNQK